MEKYINLKYDRYSLIKISNAIFLKKYLRRFSLQHRIY